MEIRRAVDDDQARKCYRVMAQLRPQWSEAEYMERVRRMREEYGYQMAYAEAGGEVKAVAGFVLREMLAFGRFLYVDDLVTDEAERSRGYGKALLDWLSGYAREQGCDELHLDSGVQRKDAHRFYLREGMSLTSYHFGKKLQ